MKAFIKVLVLVSASLASAAIVRAPSRHRAAPAASLLSTSGGLRGSGNVSRHAAATKQQPAGGPTFAAASMQWSDMGAGCCISFGIRQLFDGEVGTLEECKQKCQEHPDCGYVAHGWSNDPKRCHILPSTSYCPHLSASATDCGTGGSSGVRSFHYTQSAPVASTTSAPAAISTAAATVSAVDQLALDLAAVRGGPAAPCSLAGGLLSMSLSPACCVSTQIVSQRGLGDFGLAAKCKSDWQCEVDGVTPKPDFESKALDEVCSDAPCLPTVVAAMNASWMTRRAADPMSRVCIGKLAARQRMDAVFYSARGAQMLSSGNNSSGNESGVMATVTGMGCFPGEATMLTDRGRVSAANVRVGDRVLVELSSGGGLAYEPIIGFLHKQEANSGSKSSYLNVQHARGEFKATANHLVFVEVEGGGRRSVLVSDLRVGDRFLALAKDDITATAPSAIVSIRPTTSKIGLYAPLTMSGTILVDGVVASAYAAAGPGLKLPHGAVHAALFPVRAYHAVLAAVAPLVGHRGRLATAGSAFSLRHILAK